MRRVSMYASLIHILYKKICYTISMQSSTRNSNTITISHHIAYVCFDPSKKTIPSFAGIAANFRTDEWIQYHRNSQEKKEKEKKHVFSLNVHMCFTRKISYDIHTFHVYCRNIFLPLYSMFVEYFRN